jgi:RNA polymerase sigma-70 factor (ECF subfamily)
MGVSTSYESNQDTTGSIAAVLTGLIDAHSGLLLRIAAVRIGPHNAEDVVAETFEIVWKHLDSNEPPHQIDRPWLVGILLNRCRMYRRQEQVWLRRLRRSTVEFEVVAELDLEDAMIGRADAASQFRSILARFASLSANERAVIALVAWAGLEPAEVASALGMADGTVRSHLHRARQILKTTVEVD